MAVRRRSVAIFAVLISAAAVVAGIAVFGIPAGLVEAFDPAPDPKWVTEPQGEPEEAGPPRPLIPGLTPAAVTGALEADGYETHGPLQISGAGMEWRSVKPGGKVIVTTGPDPTGVTEVQATANGRDAAEVFPAAVRAAGGDPEEAAAWVGGQAPEGVVGGLRVFRRSGGGSMLVLQITPAGQPESPVAEGTEPTPGHSTEEPKPAAEAPSP